MSRLAQHRLDALPQERYFLRSLRVGIRCEQAHEAQFARLLAVGPIELQAHVIHVGAPMNPREDARLRDDQRRRPEHELADLRCQLQFLATPRQFADARIAQHTKATALDGHEFAGLRITVQLVFARAEKRKLPVEQPLAERHRLGDHARRQRRRALVDFRGGLLQSRQHPPPVDNGHSHRCHHVADRAFQALHLAFRDVVHHRDDQAFLAAVAPVAVTGPDDRDAFAHLVPLDLERRVDDQIGADALRVEFAQQAVQQEGHVVIGDHQQAAPGPEVGLQRLDADLRSPRVALFVKSVGTPGDFGEQRGLEMVQVGHVRAAEQQPGKPGEFTARLEAFYRLFQRRHGALRSAVVHRSCPGDYLVLLPHRDYGTFRPPDQSVPVNGSFSAQVPSNPLPTHSLAAAFLWQTSQN